MTDFKETPSQTAGPYVHIGCVPFVCGLEPRQFGSMLGQKLVEKDADGELISLEITVLDGAGDPVRDVLIEIWQADPDGGYAGYPRFHYWARQSGDFETGVARFETLKPGNSDGTAPHILVWIAARGINLGLTTRIYFPDETNDGDLVYTAAGPRAKSMLAEPIKGGYKHIIHLQGANETVFLDV